MESATMGSATPVRKKNKRFRRITLYPTSMPSLIALTKSSEPIMLHLILCLFLTSPINLHLLNLTRIINRPAAFPLSISFD